jgi:hypothetical protein
MKSSDQLNDLAAALAKAQGEMTHAEKGKRNPHFGNTYADIASIIEAIREPFSKYGLSYAQLPTYLEGKSVLATRMMHSSGQWIESHTPILASKADAQGFGSGLTYARRYALAAIAGIAQDDDDGNAAMQKNQQTQKPKPAAAPPAKPKTEARKNEAPVSQDQIKMLFAVAGSKDIKHEQMKGMISIFYGLQSTKDLKVWQLNEIVDLIKTKSVDQINVLLVEKQSESEMNQQKDQVKT